MLFPFRYIYKVLETVQQSKPQWKGINRRKSGIWKQLSFARMHILCIFIEFSQAVKNGHSVEDRSILTSASTVVSIS